MKIAKFNFTKIEIAPGGRALLEAPLKKRGTHRKNSEKITTAVTFSP